jgi:hypothetical protein
VSQTSALVWPLVGVFGLGFGVASITFSFPSLGLCAGLCALAAGVGSVRGLQPAEKELVVEHAVIVDELDVLTPSRTGSHSGLLLGPEYFDVAVRSRVTSARRFLKPVAIVRIRLVTSGGRTPAHDAAVAQIVGATLRECDTAFVLNDADLALILEDTPENGAIWVVERLRRALSDAEPMNVWAGVACYPAHAMSADEVLAQAEEALVRAREWPQDRIEVAFAD